MYRKRMQKRRSWCIDLWLAVDLYSNYLQTPIVHFINQKSMAKSASKSAAQKSGSEKRSLIEPKGDKRYIKRNEKGQIKESDDQGKSLSQDVKQHAKKEVKPGYGDQGDQPRKKTGPAKKSAAKKK